MAVVSSRFERSTDLTWRHWIIFWLLTLFLHSAVFLFHFAWTSPLIHPKVELQTVSPETLGSIRKQWEQKEKQFLLNKQATSPDSSVARPDDARYESDRNTRVAREQKTKFTQVIPKAGHPAPTTVPNRPASQATQNRPVPALAKMGIPFRLNAKPEKRPPSPTLAGQNGGDQYIEEKLSEGDENILNTVESKYYSFRARIYQAIGPIWESKTREISYRQILRPGEYTTVVDVVLDSGGELLDIRHLKDSGIRALDLAVDSSWRRIARFPNPPKGLLDAQQEVHMLYSFTLHVDESSGFQYLPPERME